MAMDHKQEKSHELRINILKSIRNPKHAMGERVGVVYEYSTRD
jgi:hypothetical protein